MLYDTHAHLNDPILIQELDNYIESAKQNGVSLINNVGYDLESSLRAVRIARENPNCYAIIGIHPHDANQWNAETEVVFRELLDNKITNKIIGIGEIGFDLHFDDRHSDEVQMQAFIGQMQLAYEYDLPVSIHSRDASDITEHALISLKNQGNFRKEKICVFHCYSYDVEYALKMKKHGFLFGFDGPVTFKNGADKREVVSALDFEDILLETDCPYMAPEPYRGRTNQPAFLTEIAKKVAEIKEVSYEKIAEITTDNGKKLFDLEKYN